MKQATLAIDPASRLADTDRRLFGSFVEHMGRCVYGGIHDPDHRRADEAGQRADVAELARELGVTVVRYPGGNFVSGYRWEDGVGPVGDRPRRLDLAWRSIEPNTFGLNEYMSWLGQVGAEPMLAVNLGTRGVAEACDLLEYCNHPGGTALSDLRRKHGRAEPYGVRLWCLGNEMDGPWQVGHKTADEYGRLAAETAKAMRLVDPGIELVACGSSSSTMPTFGSWEATVLEHTYDQVDYVSLHSYYDPQPDLSVPADLDSFLASATDMDAFIDAVVSTADHVGAKLRSRKRLKLSYDEWNVWYQSRFTQPIEREFMTAPPLIEDDYNAADAVVVGNLLISLLRHADRVGVANQAQLVNVIAPIRTIPGGPSWRQSIFHPFALTARHALPTVLHAELSAPRHHTRRYGDVSDVDAVATTDAETGELAVFAVNRGREPVELAVRLPDHAGGWTVEHTELADDDLTAVNTPEAPDRIAPRRHAPTGTEAARHTAALPPVSWHLLRFTR